MIKPHNTVLQDSCDDCDSVGATEGSDHITACQTEVQPSTTYLGAQVEEKPQKQTYKELETMTEHIGNPSTSNSFDQIERDNAPDIVEQIKHTCDSEENQEENRRDSNTETGSDHITADPTRESCTSIPSGLQSLEVNTTPANEEISSNHDTNSLNIVARVEHNVEENQEENRRDSSTGTRSNPVIADPSSESSTSMLQTVSQKTEGLHIEERDALYFDEQRSSLEGNSGPVNEGIKQSTHTPQKYDMYQSQADEMSVCHKDSKSNMPDDFGRSSLHLACQ